MHAIRRILPVGLIALSSAFGQEANEAAPAPAAPLPPAVPAIPANPGNPTPAPAPANPIPGNPVIPPGGRPPRGPAAQAGQPGQVLPNQDDRPLAERKVTETINAQKITGNELADLYHKYTGRRVVVSAAAAQAEFSFVQEASVKEPLTYKQASDLLKMSALTEGFVFVPAEEGVDRLLFAGNAANNPKGLAGIYSDEDVLPDSDLVISYVMTFRYLKPEQALQVFNQVIGQVGGAYGSIAAVANASALVITENTSVIRKLIQLKEEIDKPSGESGKLFIKVQYADVTELAQTLNELLSTQQQAQRTAGIQRAENNIPQGVPGQQGGNRGNTATAAGEDTPVQIVPDPRTNRIFAMGRPVDLKFVESLIHEFDTKTDDRNFLRRRLRFLAANDFLEVAGNALNRAFTGTGTGSGGGGGAGSTGANFGGGGGGRTTGGASGGRTSGSTGSRTSATGSSSSSGGFGSSGSSGGFGGSSGSGGSSLGSSGLSDPNVSTAPQSILVGRTLLVADNITNSIIVQGPPASVEVIEKLLNQVDVKADQVMISTVFGQLTVNDNLDYGVDFLKTFGNKKTGVAGGSTPTTDTPSVPINPAALLTPANFPASNGLNIYGTIGRSYSLYLSALQATGNFTVLSRPSIYTANNKKGVISSGQQIAVPTNTYNNASSTGTTGGVQTNIEYKDVVLKLEVIPLINSENEITLQIALISDEVGANQTVGDLTVPTIITREMTTTVTVPNNQTVVLGGLIISRDRDSVSGIPILSKIPGLGKLFSSTTKDKEKSELLIFMQPSIVRADKQLDSVQDDMDRRYKIASDLRNFGDGPGSIAPPDGVPVVSDKAAAPAPAASKKSNAPADYDAQATKKPARLGRR
ncbi:secretin N-terminal domain-containing protein [Luteolibacter sp. LG18]|uniref:secretin N-terminal domain-containing protein n=1 Tax=Luteolibacter sp. LG18 TaxID=2819286 RepID=UPI002B2D5949|nr:hypothetical protein llg_37410 [Luteolibacter sp. LG18]